MGGHVTRRRYIQDPQTFELIPAEEYARPPSADYHVMPDIQPYISMIDGRVINSRSVHRRHLRSHGCIEVGNERMDPKPMGVAPGLKDDIIRAVERHAR